MSLTKAEQRGLKSFRNYENNLPTYQQLFFGALPISVLLPIGLGMISYLSYQDGQPITAMVCLGTICGAWRLYFRSALASMRVWTVLIRVIDWEKYDELMEQESVQEKRS